MKKITFIFSFLFSIASVAQERKVELSLCDEIQHNFSYDSLAFLSCKNTPTGFYAIKFRVNTKKKFYDFVALSDSFQRLNQLFSNAIKKSNNSSVAKTMHTGTYLQIIYFNNILSCNPFRANDNSFQIGIPDTSTNFIVNSNSEIIRVLSNQLISIEKSLVNFQSSKLGSEVIVLPPVLINEKPDKTKPSFKNDITPSTMPPDAIERILNQTKKKGKDQ